MTGTFTPSAGLSALDRQEVEQGEEQDGHHIGVEGIASSNRRLSSAVHVCAMGAGPVATSADEP